jgi:hypothetical protein
MQRPLWQIVLSIMVLSFAARLAVAGISFHLQTGYTPMIVAYALQGVVGASIWASILWAQRMLPAAVWSYGSAIAITAALEGLLYRVQPLTTTIIQISAALIIGGAVAFGLRSSRTARARH